MFQPEPSPTPDRPGFLVSLPWRAAALACLFRMTAEAGVVINEIHYEPVGNTEQLEFVELHNDGAETVDVSGWRLNDGIGFTIAAGTSMAPGGYLVIAENPEELKARFGVDAVGPWDDEEQVDELGNVLRIDRGRLSNDGERVALVDAAGAVVDEVDYKVRFPWPLGSAGDGGSMELINPALDNDLGSSWRASLPPGVLPAATLLEAGSAGWKVRKADSEASVPADAWRAADFTVDGTWADARSPIGFGGVGAVAWNFELPDMQNTYSGTYARATFTVNEGEIPAMLLLRYLVDDGIVIWINGQEVARNRAPVGELNFESTATGSPSPEDAWNEAELTNVAGYIREGTNVIAVHAMNSSIGGSDFGFDVALIRPAPAETPLAAPTPGARNSTYVDNSPPNIRQVEHSPKTPTSSQTSLITVKVTDPDGVASVRLLYQLVAPGNHVPAWLPHSSNAMRAGRWDRDTPREPNPAFEDPANWTTVVMADDGTGGDEAAGDAVYSAQIPAAGNRTLVRYRIVATDARDAAVRAPFADDPSLNFAYYVYDGMPDYPAETSVVNNGFVHSGEALNSIPVYALLTRNEDIRQCYAYSSGDQMPKASEGSRTYNWDGAMVYDGVVYDHISYRLRGANGRYQGTGKRSMKIKFNRGMHLEARDMQGEKFPTQWRVLNVGKMFSNRGVGNMGLVETMNNQLWRMMGVPAPFTFWFHLRVVDGVQESPDQYSGDFWGMFLGFERYDASFLEAHGMEKGNIYKLSDGVNDYRELQRYQAPDAVSDGSDWRDTKRNFTSSKDEAWIMAHANMDMWYRWSAVKEAVQHYDWPSPSDKNMCWYFEPPYLGENDGYGRLWLLPYDHDDTWGPVWNSGIETIKAAVTNSDTTIRVGEKNVVREFRDLIWQPDQLDTMIDTLAGSIGAFHQADRDRWRRAPASEGREDWGSLEAKVADMKKFAWEGGSWPGGTVRAGGRAAYLDTYVRDSDIPETPQIRYVGTAGFPFDGLSFESTAFADPDGADSFGAMQWRLAEVTPVGGGTESLITEGSTWRYLDTGIDAGTAWRARGFDDSGWQAAPAQFGYGDNDETTILNFGEDPSSKFITSYFRIAFDIAEPETYESLLVGLMRDDGAVVYLNGEEVVRDNMPAGVIGFDTLAADRTSSEDAFFEHEVSAAGLVAGRNVLAVELHQANPGDSDTSFDLWLTAEKRRIPAGTTQVKYEWFADWDSGAVTTFTPQVTLPADIVRPGRTYRARVRHRDNTERWSSWSPALEFVASGPDIAPWQQGLVITEIMFNPADPTAEESAAGFSAGDFEFLEVYNRGETPLDMANVRFTKGVDFDFSTGSIATLAPGKVALVVANRAAFEMRHGVGLPIAGSWDSNDRLANNGERLKLSIGAGIGLRDFAYDDASPWPDGADGDGFSLELIDPAGDPDHSLGSNWRASATLDGSPGTVGAVVVVPSLDVPLTVEIQTLSVDGTSGDYLTVTFREPAGRTLDAETSADLVTWLPLATEPVSETANGDGSVTRVLRAPAPVGDVRAFYLRLRSTE